MPAKLTLLQFNVTWCVPNASTPFVTVRVAAVIVVRLITPLVELVLPAPSRRSSVTLPLPALILVPLAMRITAAPGSRWLSTTPFARRALAIRVSAPLSVVRLAFSKMLRPACKVSAPPAPAGLLTISGSASVRSLLAGRVTAVPLFSVRARKAGVMLMVCAWARAKVSRFGSVNPAATPPPVSVAKRARKV